MERSNKFVKVICWVLVVLLLLGGVGLILFFTNGGNEEFKTFYLVYNKNPIVAGESRLGLEVGKEHRFDVNYPLDIGKDELRDYSVKIIANTEVSFDFTIDGDLYNWRGEKDFTDIFDLTKEEDHFVLKLPADITLKTLLEAAHKGKAGEFNAELREKLKDEDLFTLVVSSYDEQITYNIHFSIPVRLECDVKLSDSSLVF